MVRVIAGRGLRHRHKGTGNLIRAGNLAAGNLTMDPPPNSERAWWEGVRARLSEPTGFHRARGRFAVRRKTCVHFCDSTFFTATFPLASHLLIGTENFTDFPVLARKRLKWNDVFA